MFLENCSYLGASLGPIGSLNSRPIVVELVENVNTIAISHGIVKELDLVLESIQPVI